MTTQEIMTGTEYTTDAELVSRTLAGDREAFNRIVSRYQILICSLAYSRIGHLGQSEDVAQETFITAWKHLRLLRQPEKLRAWLCGIVRNRAKKCLQHEVRQPVYDAEPLDALENVIAPVALPSDETISQEEQALLWRALQRMPELYREPLILFYREHQSIENVAAELDLSEDAVKQRLSRGRKLLREEVAVFVENTLRRSAPAESFSSGVLAALPLIGGPVATTAGMGAVGKGALAGKGLLAALLLPFIGVLSGFGAQWLMFGGRGSHVSKLRLVITWAATIAFAIVGQAAVTVAGRYFHWSEPVYFAAMAGFWWFYITCMATWLVFIYRQTQKNIQNGKIDVGPEEPGSLGRLAAITAGTHFMLFWGIIRLAWSNDDWPGAVVITGLMVALGVWNFIHQRGPGSRGLRMGPAYLKQLASCTVAVIAIFNLRLDLWLAHGYGVTVAELHQRMPVWMVPALTLVLLLWTTGLLTVTRPQADASVSVN